MGALWAGSPGGTTRASRTRPGHIVEDLDVTSLDHGLDGRSVGVGRADLSLFGRTQTQHAALGKLDLQRS